jgi:hypothetical protein
VNVPKIVTVTGAAGQIGYAALFRIGSGALLGSDINGFSRARIDASVAGLADERAAVEALGLLS